MARALSRHEVPAVVLEMFEAAAGVGAGAKSLAAAKREARQRQFEADVRTLGVLLEARGIPAPEREVQFALPDREWAFDLAWSDVKLALEVEGGVYVQGRHSRGAGMVEDMAKYNSAILLGWRVLRLEPKKLASGATASLIQNARRCITTGVASPLPEEYRKCGSRKARVGARPGRRPRARK